MMWSMATFRNEVSLASFSNASPSMTEKLYCVKYMKGHVAIMPVAGHS
jgi:hypothetical protein